MIDIAILYDYRFVLLTGLLGTVAITTCSIIIGTGIAIPLSVAMNSRFTALRLAVNGFVFVMRGVPLLVLLTGVYYVLPVLSGFKLSAFTTSLIVFSTYLSAFVSDVLRSAIASVPMGLIDTGKSLGLSSVDIHKAIVFPWVLRSSIAPVFSLYLGLLKYSTIASVISAHEIQHAGDLIMLNELRPLEAFGATCLLFLFISVPASILVRMVEANYSIRPEQAQL